MRVTCSLGGRLSRFPGPRTHDRYDTDHRIRRGNLGLDALGQRVEGPKLPERYPVLLRDWANAAEYVGYYPREAHIASQRHGQRRAAEAIPLVRLALQGPMESSNAYITRTELQALLARAFAAAGQPDSAARYRDAARGAWRSRLQTPALRCARPSGK